MSDKIIFVRLRHTMEEIVGKLIDQTQEGDVRIDHPVTLTRASPQSNSLTFIPWCILRSDRVFLIREDDVLVAGEVPEKLEQAYKEFHSGIALPPAAGSLIVAPPSNVSPIKR